MIQRDAACPEGRWPGGRQRLVTMRLTGDDDVAGYFGIGEHFV
jgi:hypothetical protein